MHAAAKLAGTTGISPTPQPPTTPTHPHALAAASQDAVAAANDSPEGGVVYLPAGRYRIDKPIVVSSSHVVIRGDGVRDLAGVCWSVAVGGGLGCVPAGLQPR